MDQPKFIEEPISLSLISVLLHLGEIPNFSSPSSNNRHLSLSSHRCCSTAGTRRYCCSEREVSPPFLGEHCTTVISAPFASAAARPRSERSAAAVTVQLASSPAASGLSSSPVLRFCCLEVRRCVEVSPSPQLPSAWSSHRFATVRAAASPSHSLGKWI